MIFLLPLLLILPSFSTDWIMYLMSMNASQDVQLPIVLNSSTFEDYDKIECGNFQILDANKKTIPYWVEYCNDTEAKVWIRTNLTDGINKFYLVDKKITEGNPNDVFLLYDDFSKATLDNTKWNDTLAGSYSIENGALKMWGNWAKGIISNMIFTSPIYIDVKMKVSQYGDTDLCVGYDAYIWGTDYALIDYNDGQDVEVSIGDVSNKVGPGLTDTNWHNITIYFSSSKYSVNTDWGVYVEESGAGKNSGWISLAGDTDSNTRYVLVDWIRVRRPYPQFLFDIVKDEGQEKGQVVYITRYKSSCEGLRIPFIVFGNKTRITNIYPTICYVIYNNKTYSLTKGRYLEVKVGSVIKTADGRIIKIGKINLPFMLSSLKQINMSAPKTSMPNINTDFLYDPMVSVILFGLIVFLLLK